MKPAQKATFARPIWFGKWRIYYDPVDGPVAGLDWAFVHDDYDGHDEADDRHGHAANPTACIAEIEEREG